MAHTPGPWVFREPESDELHEIYAESGGELICFPVWTHNQKANIPLIAAAPELLDALREIVHYDEGSSEPESYGYEVLSRCKAAIAKAEGRE